MTSSKKTVQAALASGLITLLLAVPVLAQDPSAQQPDRPGNDPAMTQGQQQRDSSSSQSQSSTDTSNTQSTTDRSTTQGQPGSSNVQTAGSTTYIAGEKYEIEGNVVSRDADTVTILTNGNQTVVVGINDQTKVKEKKRNPFRGAKTFAVTNLLPGLEVEVKGRADSSGHVLADEIKLTQDGLRTAMAIETRVNPVERELAETQQNAERMSGQLNELNAVSNAARGGAVAAQETADKAMNAAGQAQSSANEANAGVRAANDRIVSLDNFDIKHSAVVNFKVDSYKLSPEAKQHLDQIAQQAANEKGYMIEVVGFASADGSANYNRRLSQNRADAVVRYLAEEHNVPLRRIITPYGFGELQPLADNSTRTGRQQNRRVEIRVLINRGIQNVTAGMQPTTSTSETGTQGNNLQNNQTQGQFGQPSNESGNANTGTTGTKNRTEEQD
ncbi:MAG: OmpA family protein [Acidobacteriota bacterium]